MNIAVYCGSNPSTDPAFVAAADALGAWIAESGHTLIYGGSSIGLMGAVSKAVLDGGGQARGVEPRFFIEAGVAQHDLTELIIVETMGERKAKMIDLADVFVALPGGVGTLEEISEIMSRMRLQMCLGPCYLLNLHGFYDGLALQLDKMVECRFFEQQDRDDMRFPSTVEELIECLEHHRLDACPLPLEPVVPEQNLL